MLSTVTDTVSHTPTKLKIKFPVFYKSAGGERDFLHTYFQMKTRITSIDSMIYALIFEETAESETKLKLRMETEINGILIVFTTGLPWPKATLLP